MKKNNIKLHYQLLSRDAQINQVSTRKEITLDNSNAFYYRPRTKFAKVMLCLSTAVGGVPGQVPPRAGTAPLGRCPPGGYTPTPPRQVHPPGRYTPLGSTPPLSRYTPTPHLRAVHAGRYGQQAGGMHPTGMHSCSALFSMISYPKSEYS